jgi:hypothetical protein
MVGILNDNKNQIPDYVPVKNKRMFQRASSYRIIEFNALLPERENQISMFCNYRNQVIPDVD